VSTAVWGFIGVVVGGLLTVAAQATAEFLRGRVAARDRQDRRDRAWRQFQRETLIDLQAAMAEYREALTRDKSQILPSRALDLQLSAARSRYQMLVHRVVSSTAREAALAWEAAALPWFPGDDDATASAEADAWEVAMRVTGEAVRATD
jgi:hypothetical protein